MKREETDQNLLDTNSSVNNDPQPPSTRLQDTIQWLKETKEIMYEGLNSYTSMQIMVLWSVVAFGAAAAYEDDTKRSTTYNVTGATAGIFTAFGGTYALLRAEANRLRLSNRAIRIEAAVTEVKQSLAAPMAVYNELAETKEELSRTEAELIAMRALEMNQLKMQQKIDALQQENNQLKLKK